MNYSYKIAIISAFSLVVFSANAQESNTVSDLVKQGVELNDQGKYAEAIAKYQEALKIEPENNQANYEMAFSLMASGKGNEGIPYVEKTIKGSTSNALTAASYDLLGSIYDEGKQSQKAIEAYQTGIKIRPDYQRLHFNLGIAYFRNKQYPEAEASAIDAIKLNPKHASSQRMYALVTFHQNKRMNALLGFCSFILLEPNGPRAAEAYNNIQHILQGGVLKDGDGRNSIQLSPKDNEETRILNLAISMTALAAQKQKLSEADLLQYQLTHIFAMAGELTEKKTDKAFFDKFLIDFFYKLAKSDNMPAFTHLVMQTNGKEENTKWMSENADKVKALNDWIATTARSF